MTRINIVNPKELTDQHLVAEYREIFMVGSSLIRSLNSPFWNDAKIPRKFTLNTGHVMFFYNKGAYLHKRYLMIVEEMKNRGMKPNIDRVFKIEQWPIKYYNDWQPQISDMNIVRERINLRISAKPNWYRKTVYE